MIGTAAARNGTKATAPVGVTASVAPATTRASSTGVSRPRRSARSTSTMTAANPAATQGSGRRPRLVGSHHSAKAAAATA